MNKTTCLCGIARVDCDYHRVTPIDPSTLVLTGWWRLPPNYALTLKAGGTVTPPPSDDGWVTLDFSWGPNECLDLAVLEPGTHYERTPEAEEAWRKYLNEWYGSEK